MICIALIGKKHGLICEDARAHRSHPDGVATGDRAACVFLRAGVHASKLHLRRRGSLQEHGAFEHPQICGYELELLRRKKAAPYLKLPDRSSSGRTEISNPKHLRPAPVTSSIRKSLRGS